MFYSSFCRSLLDILTETSTFAKCYTLIGMIPLLSVEEINFLSRSLPPECSFLTRKGLVHLLPSPLRGMFDVNGTENVESTKGFYNDDSDETGNGYEILGDRPGDFFTSQFFLRPRASAPEKRQTTRSTALPLISELLQTRTTTSLIFDSARFRRDRMGHGAVYHERASNSGQTGTILSTNPVVGSPVTASNSLALPIVEGDFDATLESILDRRSQATSDWLFQKTVSFVSSSVSRICTGGSISDGTMIGIIGVCTASAGVASLAQQSFGDSLKQMEIFGVSKGRVTHALQQAALTTLKCVVPVVSAVAVTAGGMLLIRKAASTSRNLFRPHTPLHRMLSYTLMLTRTLQLQSSRVFPSGSFFLTNPTLVIVLSAWSLTAFVAWRLKSRVKSFKWLFDIILSKFVGDYETIVKIYRDLNM